MKTYIFRIELIEEDDGRWSAGVPALPGCATWGYTREEALENIQEAASLCIKDMLESGETIPEEAYIQVIPGPAVTVTVFDETTPTEGNS